MFVDFVNSFIDELKQFRDCYCNEFEFDEALLSERSSDQKDKSCFQGPKVQDEVELLSRGQDLWER